MAILSRLNIVSGERLDVPDMARIESAISADFLQLTKHFFTSNQSFIVSGFTVSPGIIGANTTQAVVDYNNAMVWHSNSAEASSSGVFIGPASLGTQNVSISNAINTTNYIYCDFTTFTGANAPRAFWSVTANNNLGGEFIANIDTARFLTVNFASTTSAGSVPATAFMVAIARTDGTGAVASLEDARNLYFRLGTGGTSPNPAATFTWPEGRTENPNTSTNSSVDPFFGADKGLDSLRAWMEAIMESIREIKGSPYWYDTSISNFTDILFDSNASYISGVGKITLSTGGIVGWTSDLFIKSIHGRLSLEIPLAQSPATLADNAVLYLDIARNYLFNNGSSIFTFNSASSTVNSSATGAFQTALDPIAGGTKQVFTGDWIKLTTDNDTYWAQITDYSLNSGATFAGAALGVAIPAGANAVKIFGGTSNYPGSSAANVQASYYQGYYTAGNASSGNPGNLKVSQRSALIIGGNHYWLAVRDDNGGGVERVYFRGIGEMLDGEETDIDDGQSDDVLTFIGSTGKTDNTPNYGNHAGNSLRAAVANALENEMLFFDSSDIHWDATTGEITFTDDITIRPANEAWTYLLSATESPLSITFDGRFVYATIDRTGAILNISTANSNLFQDQTTVPISSTQLSNIPLFYRKGSVLYGPDNTRWADGKTQPIGGAVPSSGPVASAFNFIQELPTGTVNGSNTVFTLSNTPSDSQNLIILLNGLLQKAGTDYTLASTTVTFAVAPAAGESIFAYYNTGVDLFKQETPVGSINSINTNYTISLACASSNNIMVFLDGLQQIETTDWAIAGTNLTFTVAPDSGQTMDVFYSTTASDLRQEGVSGAVNGSNTSFGISGAVSNNSLYLTVDGLYQKPTADYGISGTTITMTVAPIATQQLYAFYQGPAGGGTTGLQDAYVSGNVITVDSTHGQFLVQNSGTSPLSGKIAKFDGDIDVTGMIDPVGVAFTVPSGPQLAAMPNYSIYVNGNEFYLKDGVGNTVQVTSGGSLDGGGGGSSNVYTNITNNTGSTINAGTPVIINLADGTMAKAAVDTLSDALVDGIVLTTVINAATANVQITGKITGNLFSSFSAGDVLFLAKTAGTLTATPPSIGVGSFVADDHVTIIGKVVLESGNKNLLLARSYVGKL